MSLSKQGKNLQQSIGATPHELVQRQIENRDYHVTDEDIEHMRISVDLSEHEKTGANREADELEKDDVGTSYEVPNY